MRSICQCDIDKKQFSCFADTNDFKTIQSTMTILQKKFFVLFWQFNGKAVFCIAKHLIRYFSMGKATI